MRIFITLIFGLVLNFTWSQYQDDFSSNSIFPSPWDGQTSEFQIDNEELRLSAVSAGNSSIYLSSGFFYYSETEIRLKIRQSFAPSGNNRLNLFIFSDSVNVINAQNALYFQFGESGSNDAIALRGIFNGNDIELVRGLDARIASSFELELKLTYADSILNLKLWNSNSNQYEPELTYTDTTGFDLNTLFLDCQYTSSNSNKFYFDNIYVGPIQYDTIPPFIEELQILDSNSMQISFSEAIDTLGFNASQFSIDNPSLQNPIAWHYSNQNLELNFPNTFSNNQSSFLNLGLISDLEGNTSQLDSMIHLLFGQNPLHRDLEITEIMADPSPSVGLPVCEYLEIRNSSQKIINLKNLMISDQTDTNRVDTNYFIYPNQYVLLTQANCIDSFSLVNCIPIDLPGLNNTSDHIKLLNQDSALIDSIKYQQQWHENDKDDGGFAFEKAELGFFCGQENWFSSQDVSGGTPGHENSYNKSSLNINFELIDWNISHSNLVELEFNKSPANAIGSGNIITSSYLVSFSVDDLVLNLNIGPDLYPGDWINIEIQNLQDCFGNQLDTLITIQRPYFADSNDLIINEILFDPESGGTDYVELYNRGSKTIDLSNLFLANRENDTIANQKAIANMKTLLFPGDFILISKDSNWIKNVFKTDNERYFIELASLPSYPNDHGYVILMDDENQIIDEVIYDVNMHYPLLEEKENKSLERIAYNVSSMNRENWNTASGHVNFGTPGYTNSQWIPVESDFDFEISDDYFTPNNDGFKDNLVIRMESDEPAIIYLSIFNIQGQLIQKLIDAEYIQGEKTVVWRGRNEQGNMTNSGFYILHLMKIVASGRKEQKRKTAYLKR